MKNTLFLFQRKSCKTKERSLFPRRPCIHSGFLPVPVSYCRPQTLLVPSICSLFNGWRSLPGNVHKMLFFFLLYKEESEDMKRAGTELFLGFWFESQLFVYSVKWWKTNIHSDQLKGSCLLNLKRVRKCFTFFFLLLTRITNKCISEFIFENTLETDFFLHALDLFRAEK